MKMLPASERRRAISVGCRFRALPEEVFAAWLDPAIAGQWLFATASQPMARVEIEPRVRGAFRLRDRANGAEYAGQYLEIVPPTRLVFTLALAHPNLATRVTVGIATVRSGCRLTLTQEKLPRNQASYAKARLTGMLYGLGLTLDARRSARSDRGPHRTKASSSGRNMNGADVASLLPSSMCPGSAGPLNRFHLGETPCNTC
jgi:uncharacterized protein YndB with AHSA1/START domain